MTQDQQIATFEGNPLIRAAGQRIAYTQAQIAEYIKCRKSFEYFAENYCKILSLDKGMVNFELFGYQERIAKNIDENRFNIIMLPRQMGKCQKLDTRNRFRDKRTGKVYVCTAKQFYDWLSFIRWCNQQGITQEPEDKAANA